MSCSGKTPVSILQETLLRQGIVPLYDLLHSGVGTHQGIFTYQVTARALGLSAIGSGRSKKEAKHEAAKCALEQLKVVVQEPLTEDILSVSSPYEASLKDNAVGALADLCVSHELPLPEYTLLREDGPPHAKLFVFSCKVSTMEEKAQGRTKKQAKQLAAYNMLNHFSESKLIDDTVLNAEKVKKPSDTNHKVLNESQKTPIGSRLVDLPKSFKTMWTEDQLSKLRSLEPPFENPQETLQNVCQDLSLEYVFDKGLQESGASEGIILILNTKPSATFIAHSPNEFELAASKALEYLQVMTWDPTICSKEVLFRRFLVPTSTS